jgi:hypothetical protein
MIPDIAVYNGFWYFVALIVAMIAWRIWGHRVTRALQDFEQRRRDADLQAYYDRMNPNAHFRQSVDQIGEQTAAVEGTSWNGEIYETREDAEAARWRHIITQARAFYIDLDRTYGNKIKGPRASDRVGDSQQ